MKKNEPAKTKGSPYFSVIIPTKNEEALIGRCLLSLSRQNTSYSYELIVVDTNSSDRTVEIAKSYNVRVINEARPGKSIAFQTGAVRARGQILCFTEADCILPTHWLSEIAKSFKHFPVVSAVTGGYTFYQSNLWYKLLARIGLPLSSYIFYFLFGHHSLRGSNFAIFKKVFKKIGGFNTKNFELYDVELSMKAKKLGLTIRFLSTLRIATSDRRIRGRLFKFIREFIISFVNVVIRHKPVTRPIYADIR